MMWPVVTQIYANCPTDLAGLVARDQDELNYEDLLFRVQQFINVSSHTRFGTQNGRDRKLKIDEYTLFLFLTDEHLSIYSISISHPQTPTP